jgi:hypothetical protein
MMERAFSSKRAKLAESKPSKYLIESTFATALEDLEANGYCWIRGAIPERLCEPCAEAIQADIGQRLDNGSVHQEEPIERLKKSTAKLLLKMRQFVERDVLSKKVSPNDKNGLQDFFPLT